MSDNHRHTAPRKGSQPHQQTQAKKPGQKGSGHDVKSASVTIFPAH
jgi:hypothetical protein